MIKKGGDIENQIVALTERINKLSQYIKVNKKDFATKRSLYRLVSKKKKFLNYYKDYDYDKYNAFIGKK
jgi:small subunit ribosomal protein S15